MSRVVQITYCCDICGVMSNDERQQPFIIKVIKEGCVGFIDKRENVCPSCKDAIVQFIKSLEVKPT